MPDPSPVRLTVSREQYEFLSEALLAMAGQAKQHGAEQAAAVIERFVIKLRDTIHDGEGVPTEKRQRFKDAIQRALASGDVQAAHKAIWALLDATIRMDPDPAQTIASEISPMMLTVAAAGAAMEHVSIATQVLRAFEMRLEAEEAAFERSGWPDSAAVMEYVRNLATFCAEEIEHGIDPFSESDADEPEEEAEPEN